MPAGRASTSSNIVAPVVENPDISQSSIARALGIERSGVVVIVDELEGRDLISRSSVEGDRRSYALRATLKGRRLYAKALERNHQSEDELLAGFSDEERNQLLAFLRRIHDVSEPD